MSKTIQSAKTYTLHTVIVTEKSYDISTRHIKSIDIVDGKLHICVQEEATLEHVTYVCSKYYFGITYPITIP